MASKLNEPFIDKTTHKERVPTFCSQRWILAYLLFFGYCFVYSLRVNISVALVCMIKSPLSNSSAIMTSQNDNATQDEQCSLQEVRLQQNQRAEFDWDKNTKSTILASFFYGYIFTQVLGGWLSDRFGGRRVFGISMAISAVATLLTPVAARTSVILVYVLRVILGLATGVAFPAGHSMWGRWAPPLERSKLVATSHVGACFGTIVTFASSGLLCEYGFDNGLASIFYITGAWFGTIVTFASSGLLCEYGFDNGWASIFYITGGLCCIWVIIWFIQVRDSPAEHPRITEVEKDYIMRNIEFDVRKRTAKVPWKQMATSLPLWAVIVAHVCANWANYTLITSLPGFMKGVLKFDIKSNGVLSAVPYICAAFVSIVAGHSADLLRRKRILTTTQTRKIYQFISFIGAGTFLVATGFVPCEKREIAVVLLCIAVMFTGFTRGGLSVNHIDIAPKYAGILFGITNTMATIPGMIAPIVAGALTPNDTAEEWRNVFYVGAAFYLFGAIFFGTFASGVLQPWANDNEKDITMTIEVENGIEMPYSKENKQSNNHAS